MTADEFIDAIYLVVYRAAIGGAMKAMESPPGRRPRQDLVELSAWFTGLADSDKRRVRDVVRLAVDHAVFGMLAVLDGVRVIDDGGRTELSLTTSDGTLLNEYPELHDLFRAKVDEERNDPRRLRLGEGKPLVAARSAVGGALKPQFSALRGASNKSQSTMRRIAVVWRFQ